MSSNSTPDSRRKAFPIWSQICLPTRCTLQAYRLAWGRVRILGLRVVRVEHPPSWARPTDHGQSDKHVVLLNQSSFANCQGLDLTTGEFSLRQCPYPMI